MNTPEPKFFGDHDGLLCDLDGVVYAGAQAIPGAVETLQTLYERGIPAVFVTNNASRSPETVAEHLKSLGVPTDAEHVYTSVDAAIEVMNQHRKKYSTAAAVLAIGTEYLHQQLRKNEYHIVETAAEQPAYVIQGLNPGLKLEDLAQASFAITQGAYWVATNKDLTFPRAEGIAPGNGSLIQAVANATGKQPDAVGGKPQPMMFQMAAKKFNMKKPLMVGDRLDTDIVGANNAQIDSALVTTGIHQRPDAQQAQISHQPRWIINSLTDLLQDPK